MTPEQLRENFSRNFRTQIASRRWTQEEFCDHFNRSPYGDPPVQRAAVSHWLNGRRLPREPVLQNICQFFGKSESDMFMDASLESAALPPYIEDIGRRCVVDPNLGMLIRRVAALSHTQRAALQSCLDYIELHHDDGLEKLDKALELIS